MLHETSQPRILVLFMCASKGSASLPLSNSSLSLLLASVTITSSTKAINNDFKEKLWRISENLAKALLGFSFADLSKNVFWCFPSLSLSMCFSPCLLIVFSFSHFGLNDAFHQHQGHFVFIFLTLFVVYCKCVIL